MKSTTTFKFWSEIPYFNSEIEFKSLKQVFISFLPHRKIKLVYIPFSDLK